METLSSIMKPGAVKTSERKAQRASEVKFFTEVIHFETDKRLELYNITAEIEDRLERSGIQEGILNVSSLHTTTALFINEYQGALLEDIKTFLKRLVGQDDTARHHCDKLGRLAYGYKHNCQYCSDCERKNADAHLGAALLGHNLCLHISEGKIVRGKWQSLLLAEMDGPKERSLVVQIIGS